MDILVKLSVPEFIYEFYDKAAKYVAGSAAEELMADALSAYAGIISKDVAQVRQQTLADRQDI